MNRVGGTVRGVPTTVIGNDYVVGADFAAIQKMLQKNFGPAEISIEAAQKRALQEKNKLKIPKDKLQKAKVNPKKNKKALPKKAVKKAETTTKENSKKRRGSTFYTREMFEKSIARPRGRYNGRKYSPQTRYKNLTKLQWQGLLQK